MRITAPAAGATLALASTLGSGGQAMAAELTIEVAIPRLDVAEYHKPYLAVWLEAVDAEATVPLAVWYDLHMADGEGRKWLKDLRQWWRHIGRSLEMPADGISGATRPPGEHEIRFDDGAAPLSDLPAGEYALVVEAAREVGGREILRLPLSWPPAAPATEIAEGSHELGRVRLDVTP